MAAGRLSVIFGLVSNHEFLLASDRLQEFRVLLIPYIALTKNADVQKKADIYYRQINAELKAENAEEATAWLSELVRLLESS